MKFLFYSKPIHPGHFSTSFLSRVFLNYLIFVNLLGSTTTFFIACEQALHLGDIICEKQTSEMNTRGDAKVGVGGAAFLGAAR